MATNATIASQIQRIAASRDILRNKGCDLKLLVPAGTYWDDATDKDVTTSVAALLKNTDQIDKIAAAFNSIIYYSDEEIKVPLLIKRDGTTVVGESKPLPTGFYANSILTPYITVENEEDLVLNIQTITGRSLSTQTGTITPASGYNYIDSLSYTIVNGAISETVAGYDNTGVTAIVLTAGWLNAGDTKKITVTTSELKSKVGSGSQTSITSGSSIEPNTTSDTVLTITKGIYGSDRTLTVKSVASLTSANAVSADILSGKTAWVNGLKVTGSMPNYGGTSSEEKYTAATSFNNVNGELAIQPALGYYNDYSFITTAIVYNPTRVFNTTSITVDSTDTMTSQTYYETIPAGYYNTEIKRKVTARSGVGSVTIDYTNHKATFDVTTPGWFGSDKSVNISAGPAVYAQTNDDLESAGHKFIITPAKDNDGTVTSYLTLVTVDNTVIYNLLSAI